MTETVKKKTNHRHWLFASGLVLLAVIFGVASIGSAMQIKSLEGFSGLIDVRPHDLSYIGVVSGILAGLALLLYLLNLSPHASSRPKKLIFLNFLAPSLYVALGLVAYDRGGASEEFGLLSYAGAPLAALLPPLLLLGLEAIGCGILRGLGHKAQEREWHRPALALLLTVLAFRPEDKDTRRRCALLYEEDEHFDKALRILAGLDIEQCSDEALLKAIEHSHRARGQIREALRVLLRMQQVLPDQAWVDRRILDDYLRLELPREALDLLESGRLKMTLELLQLAEKLNLALGNYAQALALIRQIAGEENRPHNQAIRLYRELLEQLPGHPEVKISLGLLLLENDIEERRREGAGLLSEVLEEEPHRLHLARKLVQFHTESNQPQEARRYLKALVEAGDPDMEYHLAYVQSLTDEEQHEEASRVLRRILKRWPEDWRGHMRLARTSLQMDLLEDAEKELAQAANLAPIDAVGLLEGIRNSIEQRRREIFVLSMRQDVAQNHCDTQKQLELIDHQIDMEWIDDALAECDRLLDDNPELLPQVIEHIERGIRKITRSFSLRNYLSDIYFRQGRYNDALQLYREMSTQSLHPAKVITDGCRMILTREPEHLDARRELALARRSEEDWAGVLEALDPPIHDNAPLAAEDKILWVEAAYRLWRLDGAVRVGLTLVEDLAEEVGFMIMMIDILMDAGEFDKAVEVFNKAKAASLGNDRLLRLESKVVNSRARHRLNVLQRQFHAEGDLNANEHFEKAELHRVLGQNEEAIVHYQRAAFDSQLAPLATAKLAETLCDRGMLDLADETLDPLELTRDLSLSHPEIKALLYRVGRMLEKLRRFDQAVKYYKRIFRVDAAYEDIVDRIERLS